MTERTNTELQTQINTLLASNDSGSITAAKLRSVLTDLIDSGPMGSDEATTFGRSLVAAANAAALLVLIGTIPATAGGTGVANNVAHTITLTGKIIADGSHDQTVIGGGALPTISNATHSSVAIGKNAMSSAAAGAGASAQYHIAIGLNALASIASGAGESANYNVAIGPHAMRYARTTYATVAIGYQAGENDVDGRTGVYIGHVAGQYVNSGSSNTAIGGYAMRGISTNHMTGVDNTAVGEACMLNLRGAANYNTGIGFNCFFGLQEASGNTGVGLGAGLSLTTGDGNSLFGLNAYGWNGGDNNTFIGYSAGEGYAFTKTTNGTTSSGGSVIKFASTADLSIGMSLYAGAYIYPGATITSIDPNVSVTIDTTCFNDIPNGATIYVIPAKHTGNFCVGIGYFAMNELSGSVSDTTAVGYSALRYNRTGVRNTAIGAYTMSAPSGGSYSSITGNTSIGYRAGRYTTSNDNTWVGDQAGRGISTTALTGTGNVGIGVEALADLRGAAEYNVGIGYRVAFNITTGIRNTIIGGGSASGLTTGSSNILVGYGAATSLINGDGNIIIGTSINVGSTSAANTLNIGNLITGTGTYGVGTASLYMAGSITMPEETDPAAPSANRGVFYMRDNGAGKTQFCVRFPTGAVQVIATQP